MATTTTRLIPGLLAGGLLLLPLAGCSGGSTSNSAGSSTAATASTTSSASTSASASTEASGGAGVSGSAGSVQCSGSTCSLTVKTGESQSVLGQQISLTSVQSGKATLNIAGQSVSCTQGQSVSFGPAQFTCSSVTDNSVTLSASAALLGGSSSSPTS